MLVPKPPVIVIRGNDICFLGTLRSLGRKKIPFKTVIFDWDNSPTFYSKHSKYFSSDFIIPNPFTNPEGALNKLIEIGEKLLGEFKTKFLVIPTSDTNLMFFINNENILQKYFLILGEKKFLSYRSDITNKNKCFSILTKKVKENCPQTFQCNNIDDIKNIPSSIKFPVVYKPSFKDYGQTFYKKHNGAKAITCNDIKFLKKQLKNELNDGFELVIQEKILFKSSSDEIPFYAYVDKNHEILMAATGIKELIMPEPFGTAYILKLSWHNELIDLARKIVKTIEWRGLIMIEFIKDQKDNTWKVIEINTRPWLFIDFYSRFGFNYVEYLYNDYQNILEQKEEFIFPSKELILENPIHIDLLSIFMNSSQINKLKIFKNNNTLINWIKSFGNIITTPYFDACDTLPAKKNLDDLEKLSNGNINSKKLLEFFEEKL
jgi:D-aspartate ligase